MRPGDGRDPIRAIARAVLYEGYMLWPHRRSALENQRRWTFGGVFPRGWTESGHPDDACTMRAECLVELPWETDGDARVDVEVRFLQVVECRVAVPEGEWLQFVPELEVGGVRHVPWDEAAERTVSIEGLHVDRPDTRERSISISAGAETEWLPDAQGCHAGALVRSWSCLRGDLRARSEMVGPRTARVSVAVRNDTPLDPQGRGAALRSSLVSTHLGLHARGARFVSLADPPAGLREAAGACTNQGCWPVLVGDRATRTDMLASPIILSDFPQVASESPGTWQMLPLHGTFRELED